MDLEAEHRDSELVRRLVIAVGLDRGHRLGSDE
jgi:hypothetical protein